MTGISCLATTIAQAQFTQVVAADNFNSYSDTSSFFVDGGGTATLVSDGNGGNAVQYSFTSAGGFMATGFDFVPTVQPGPGGPNISSDRADYQISFELTINSTYTPANGFEIWAKDQAGQGDPQGDPSASLYSVGLGSFTTGVPQTVSFTLDSSINDAPFGYTDGSGFDPTVDQVRIRFDGLDFNSPADTFTFTVDNFTLNTVPVPEPSTCALGLAGLAAMVVARRNRRQLSALKS